jgi:putative aldouronate transport system substrate-binding protein
MEGVQYEVKDGKRTLPAAYNADKDGFYTDFWGGRNDKLEIPSATIYPNYKDIFAANDKIKTVYPYGRFVFNKQAVENEIAAIGDVITKNVPAISVGKAGDPEKAVTEFRNQLKKAGYDKYLAEVQKQMNDYKKLVTGK